MPIVVKDNIEVARLPSTGGTPALKGYVPKADAPVVKRLRDAGAIVLGKTNMHELAFGISGYNPAYNTGAEVGVRNAYDASRSAGGSSSGTGAALGARIVLAGLGTDTGGSVRVPCAFNGCAALRPTVGRYSQKGILPISHTRDTAGPMALAMSDVELLDRVISGAKRGQGRRPEGGAIGAGERLPGQPGCRHAGGVRCRAGQGQSGGRDGGRCADAQADGAQRRGRAFRSRCTRPMTTSSST